ncbi:MAG: GDCCVxC domain-containing (seleno)protein [Acidimicrobiales bacterium]
MATLKCPRCATTHEAEPPSDACQWAYVCPGCGERITPLAGDCCVFCSYSDVRCDYAHGS